MNISFGNCRLRLAVLSTAVIGGFIVCQVVAAQGSDSSRSLEERVKIQPYTGKPIYLDEPQQVAPPRLVNHQTKVEKYDDGTTRAERELALYSDNHFEADGVYREYYNSGKPFVEGKFSRGLQDGQWTYWYENGQVNRKATYKKGQPDGAWEVFREDGTLMARRGFRDGLRHGEWIKFDKTGEQPLREEHYDNGKADGVWKAWYPNGRLKQQNSFKQGIRHGTSTEWTENGDKRGEVTYVDNKLDGPATLWLPDGKKLVQQYKEGRLISESKQ
jgi:antitoxin component YwqK of YwqJK toxin-antitoxin module